MEILLIDDQPAFAAKLQVMIENRGHQVHSHQSATPVLEMKEEELKKYDMAIIDRQMPDHDGLEVGVKLKKRHPHLVTLMLTGDDSKETIIRALRDSFFDDYMSKRELVQDVFSGQHYLQSTLMRAESLAETRRKLEATENLLMQEMKLNETLRQQSVNVSRGMIGRCEAFKRMVKLIQKVAPTDSTVLIQGETGTGKELVAREVHKHSTRAKDPFVAINCAAIPRDLLESELFGHEAGAFTGANHSREGFIKMANRGTLFLDEIGDMPLELQSKLLRVIQEKEVTPVGGRKSQKVNVRIISATHQQLTQKVQNNEFREDLYYRLNVFPIKVPPLRERLEDLEPLIDHFITIKGYHPTIKGIEPNALALLKQRQWNGNIRELENTVERALIVASPPKLQVKDFYEPALLADEPLGVSLPSEAPAQPAQSAIKQEAKRVLMREDCEDLWNTFESNGYKLWRIVNEMSLRMKLLELLPKSHYHIQGRMGVLLMAEQTDLPVKIQFVHPETRTVEEVTLVFRFYSDFEDRPSFSGKKRKHGIPKPGSSLLQPVTKGLPDTYIFDALYPRPKAGHWETHSPQELIRACVLRYALYHAAKPKFTLVFEEVLTPLLDERLSQMIPSLEHHGLEAMRIHLTSPSHIFSKVPSYLKANREKLQLEVKKIFTSFKEPRKEE